MPEEQKRKISEAHKGKIPKNIKMIAGWNRGRKFPERSGKNCHLWKGGITDENHKIRSSIEFRLWRKAVFERDNFTCQKTGIKGGYLVAHHINNFAEYPELRFAIDNGITLSKQTHYNFHKIYGIKNNTKEQLEEFLCHK